MLTNPAGAPRSTAAESRFTGPLSPGQVDGLGERWTTADPEPVELLRFRGEIATTAGFEDALRQRVAALADFKDPGFAAVRELVQDGDHLTLVSTRVAGQRLSDLLGRIPKGKRVSFVTRLLRDATRALSELEAVGDGVTHAALTVDRILLTPEGRVCITEHALASALQELALWPEELWTEFGLLARADTNGEAVFDSRTTVMQLAAIALSVLLSRPLTLQDVEHGLPALLDEFSALDTSASSVVAEPLRVWLERAFQLGAEPYPSALAAEAGLRDLLSALGPAGAVEVDTIQFPVKVDAAAAKPNVTATMKPVPAPAVKQLPAPALNQQQRTGASPVPPPAPQMVIADGDRGWTGVKPVSRREQYAIWAAVALAVVALGEAIALTRLTMRPPTVVLTDSSIVVESARPGDTVMVDGKPAGSTPVKVRVNPQTQAIRLVAASPATPAPDPAAAAAQAETARAAAALDLAAARQRTGGLQIRAPINLTVLEGDRVLGSTADGPIVAAAGTRQLDFVNPALGFRTRQSVTIRAGVIAPLTITPPMGRISINAQPWAQVLIDDQPVGETPLANVQVPIGEHQIIFRHPQMGERRERVTVRADAPARISVAFQR